MGWADLPGLRWKSLKGHPALFPLYIAYGTAMSLVGCILFRLAVFNPDVSWNKWNYPMPNQLLAPEKKRIMQQRDDTHFSPNNVPMIRKELYEEVNVQGRPT